MDNFFYETKENKIYFLNASIHKNEIMLKHDCKKNYNMMKKKYQIMPFKSIKKVNL